MAYGITIFPPVVSSANAVRLDNQFAALAATTQQQPERYLTIGGNSTLFVKGGAGGGTLTILKSRATVGDPKYQGVHAVPDITVSVDQNHIKRVPVQAAMYLDPRGVLICHVSGNISVLALRREVEGQ